MNVLTRNLTGAQDLSELSIPAKADGSLYRYEMICDSGWSRLYSDSVEGLIEHLIPGFAEMSEPEQITARIRHAVDMQVRLQAQLNVDFRDAERTPDEEALLTGPRHIQPSIGEWASAVPLVLVDAFYAPYGDVPRPISSLGDVQYAENVWWLNPNGGSMEYLRSLHESSVIHLNIARDEAV